MNKFVIPGLAALGIVAGIATGGVVANAATTSTNASTTPSGTSSTTSTQSTQSPVGGVPNGPHQYNGKTETALTGDNLAKATAAAKTKEPTATVTRAETDVDGDGTYEVHMQKSDGTQVTVFLDANFTVTSETNGMSAKNPGPQNGPAPQQNTSSSSQQN